MAKDEILFKGLREALLSKWKLLRKEPYRNALIVFLTMAEKKGGEATESLLVNELKSKMDNRDVSMAITILENNGLIHKVGKLKGYLHITDTEKFLILTPFGRRIRNYMPNIYKHYKIFESGIKEKKGLWAPGPGLPEVFSYLFKDALCLEGSVYTSIKKYPRGGGSFVITIENCKNHHKNEQCIECDTCKRTIKSDVANEYIEGIAGKGQHIRINNADEIPYKRIEGRCIYEIKYNVDG